MATSLALVHHANQYLITDGYDNREGIKSVVGVPGTRSGLRHVLGLHAQYSIPLNLHLSGTLIEAIAWHEPEFLQYVKDLLQTGLIELVGSCYGQNIMRFFGPDYNRRQLNEELLLYRMHLGIDPETVKVFWPPERVWETRRMASVLRDARLLNDGYRYVILDDRLLLSPTDPLNPRSAYDFSGAWNTELFKMHEIEDGLGLVAFPIGTRLRRSIPPRADEDWRKVQSELEGLLVHAQEAGENGCLAIYADDMEKVAGIGEWGPEGPERYEAFLKWLVEKKWVDAVLLTRWASSNQVSTRRRIERGTFQELAVDFDAGEGYERWFLASDWAPYRGHFNWAEAKVRQSRTAGADPPLLELAEKQLLVSNWETAWHTPASGPHGDPDQNGHASPWARALTSHSRLAAVTAEAAHAMVEADPHVQATLLDIDNDGESELILRNDQVFAVLSPTWGGRITALYSIGGPRGAMVIGNPCDDWNWMEELNKYMEVPRNHPGALADVGFEHDTYEVEMLPDAAGQSTRVRLTNTARESLLHGCVKEIELAQHSSTLRVRYRLPETIQKLSVEFGLSPDYLQLLRSGSRLLETVEESPQRHGCASGMFSVLVSLNGGETRFEAPSQPLFGHGCMLRVSSTSREFSFDLGVTVSADPHLVAGEPQPVLLETL